MNGQAKKGSNLLYRINLVFIEYITFHLFVSPNFKTMSKLVFLFFLLSTLNFYSCNKSKEDELVNQFLTLDGKYIQQDSIYVYNKKLEIETILKSYENQELVLWLHKNLDNEKVSNSSINGKNVPVGYVFYEALTQTIVYEPTDSTGDVASHWDGYIEITPQINLEDLHKVKNAWKNIIQTNKFNHL